MLANAFTELQDFLHLSLCYQLFITPLPIPLEKEYREFARRACTHLMEERSNIIHRTQPRRHVLHHFAQPLNRHAKKVLITHGWMSRAAYMIRSIRALHEAGFEVFALDFPAHGEAGGWQLPWIDAVSVLHQVLKDFGPFYAVIGHSFGGSMALNTLNLSYQSENWHIETKPERLILLAAPTRMYKPIGILARKLSLKKKCFVQLCKLIGEKANTDLKKLHFRYFTEKSTIPTLCIHGKQDTSVSPLESILFCRSYPYASLSLIKEIDHVGILIDPKVEHRVVDFLVSKSV